MIQCFDYRTNTISRFIRKPILYAGIKSVSMTHCQRRRMLKRPVYLGVWHVPERMTFDNRLFSFSFSFFIHALFFSNLINFWYFTKRWRSDSILRYTPVFQTISVWSISISSFCFFVHVLFDSVRKNIINSNSNYFAITLFSLFIAFRKYSV